MTLVSHITGRSIGREWRYLSDHALAERWVARHSEDLRWIVGLALGEDSSGEGVGGDVLRSPAAKQPRIAAAAYSQSRVVCFEAALRCRGGGVEDRRRERAAAVVAVEHIVGRLRAAA